MSCIIGTIMYCTTAMYIHGPVHTLQTYLGNEAWRYTAYYGPPTIQPMPSFFPVTRRG